jgi:hypothetical protein
VDQYDARDAADVSRTIREGDSLTRRADELTALYQEVVEAHGVDELHCESASSAWGEYAQRLCRAINESQLRPHSAARAWREQIKTLVRSVTGRFTGRSPRPRKAA